MNGTATSVVSSGSTTQMAVARRSAAPITSGSSEASARRLVSAEPRARNNRNTASSAEKPTICPGDQWASRRDQRIS